MMYNKIASYNEAQVWHMKFPSPCLREWPNALAVAAVVVMLSFKCAHSVMRGHFRSRDEDGGHTIRSAIFDYSMLQTNLHGCVFYRTKVIADRSSTLRKWGFSTYFAPVTLVLTRWPSYTNLTRIPSRYTGCAKINFQRQVFQKLSSNRHTDRQRHTALKLYTTPLRVWSVKFRVVRSALTVNR